MGKLTTLVLVTLALLTCDVIGGNRFPVIAHGENSAVSNREQFYQWADEWGASLFYCTTDSIAKYIVQNGLQYDLVAPNYRFVDSLRDQRIFISAAESGANAIELNQATTRNLIISFQWDAINQIPGEGYKPDSTLTGTSTPDVTLGRSVRKAQAGLDGAGYLQYRFAAGTAFRMAPKITPENELATFEVSLKIGDRSGDPNVVVAQLRFGSERYLTPSATLDIKVGDFADTTSYHKFYLPITLSGTFARFQYDVYWTSEKTIHLDSMQVTNVKGRHFDAIVRDSLQAAILRVSEYYQAHPNENSTVKHIYLMDEPAGPELVQYEKLNFLINNSSSSVPKSQLTTLGAYVGELPNADPTRHSYFDAFYRYSGQSILNYDDYRLTCNVSTSAQQWSSASSIQYQMDKAFIPHLKIARQRALAQTPPGVFWVTLPLFAAFGGDDPGPYTKTFRLPTGSEIRMMVNLSLLYGAKGIGYWELMGRGGSDHDGVSSVDETASEPELESWNEETQTPQLMASTYGSEPASCYTCSTVTSANRPYVFKGVFRVDDGVAIREPLWDSTKIINQYLDSMAYFFLNATLQGASSNHNQLASVQGSFIDSITSLSGYEKPFIETGFFQFASVPHAFILNRRVDDGTCGGVDTQTVRVYMQGLGAFQIWDVYANKCDTIFDSLGVLLWDHKFEPGEAILIKRLQASIKGSWSGVWPQYTTLKIVGDVTIPSGKTLTIRTPVSVKANSDSLSSGWSATKSEIIVNGTLILDGTASNRIIFQPDQTADSSWYGIRVGVNGTLDADNVVIKKAYAGVSLLYADASIVNSRIDNCFMYGVYSEGSTYTMDHDTLLSTNTNISEDSVVYGMNWGVRATGDDQGVGPTISNCYFANMKRPVDIFWSYGKLRNCLITRSGLYQSLGKGMPAINLGRYAKVDSIYNCEIRNYKYGVKAAGARMSALVQSCDIGSDLKRDSTHPYMYIGVNADSGYLANCRIRSTCFRSIEQYHIFRRWTIVDAGTSGDFGHNNFFVDTVRVHPPCTIPVTMDTIPDPGNTCAFFRCPEIVIYNVGGATVDAQGNYWAEFYYYPRDTIGVENTLSNNIYGPVDTLSPYIVPDLFCESNPPPEMKPALTNSAPAGPREFSLDQNYPNPFNPETEISFYLPTASKVRVDIFNVLGQRIVTLVDDLLSPGQHTVRWNSRDEGGTSVASGLYLYRVSAGNLSLTKKMLLMK